MEISQWKHMLCMETAMNEKLNEMWEYKKMDLKLIN